MLVDVVGQVEFAASLDQGNRAERVYVESVTDNYFSALGVQARLGRLFVAGDDRVAVLSYKGWTQHFGRDASVIGRTVRIGDRLFRLLE